MSAEPQHSSTLPEWIVEHMDQYLAMNGEDGHIWRGVPTLLLTTIGRRSGTPFFENKTTPPAKLAGQLRCAALAERGEH